MGNTLPFPHSNLIMYSNTQEVFLQKLTSLRRCLERREIGDTLEFSALLRFLLLEGNVAKVNREIRQRIAYRLGPEDSGFVFDFRLKVNGEDILSHAKHPGLNLDLPPEMGSLNRLLQHPLLRVLDQHYTIHEVVSIVANKLGGVHLDESSITDDRKVMFLNDLKRTWTGDVDALYDSLRTIAVITLEALIPLETVIRGREPQ